MRKPEETKPSSLCWSRTAQRKSSFFATVCKGIANGFRFSSSITKEPSSYLQDGFELRKPDFTTVPGGHSFFGRAGKEPGNRLTPILLQSVARGEQDKAASILTSCPHLLSLRGDVTDYSGRTFKNITAFQYALWAMDTHMCRMIISAIPDGVEGDGLRAELIHQYDELDALGVTYQLAEQTYTEQHFDFSRLLDALQTYVDRYDGWHQEVPINWAAINHHWCKVVGMAQRYVPAHVAQQYCHPVRLGYPTPTFNEPTLERSLTFYHWLNRSQMTWWPGDGSSSLCLGEDFGISGWVLGRVGACGARAGGAVDLGFVTALCKASTSDLKQTLEILTRGGSVAKSQGHN